jgi:hypothetical protein
MSSESSTLGDLLDELVDGFLGAIAAPVELTLTTLHGRPSLSSLESASDASSTPSLEEASLER